MLEKFRTGDPHTAKEKQIHDQGLVTVFRQIHDEPDAAVLDADGGRIHSRKHRTSGGLRPSKANEEAPSLPPNGIDAHRAPLQCTLAGTDTDSSQSKFLNHQSLFGRKNKKRGEQIEEIIEMLKGLGQL